MAELVGRSPTRTATTSSSPLGPRTSTRRTTMTTITLANNPRRLKLQLPRRRRRRRGKSRRTDVPWSGSSPWTLTTSLRLLGRHISTSKVSRRLSGELKRRRRGDSPKALRSMIMVLRMISLSIVVDLHLLHHRLQPLVLPLVAAPTTPVQDLHSHTTPPLEAECLPWPSQHVHATNKSTYCFLLRSISIFRTLSPLLAALLQQPTVHPVYTLRHFLPRFRSSWDCF